jgi:hypothetical protein
MGPVGLVLPLALSVGGAVLAVAVVRRFAPKRRVAAFRS